MKNSPSLLKLASSSPCDAPSGSFAGARKLLILLAMALAGGAAFTSARATDENAPPVGFTHLPLTPGFNAISVSFLNLDTTKGQVASPAGVIANVVTLSDTTVNAAVGLSSAKQYYLEVIADGASDLGYAGERFEIDVPATIAVASNKYVLQASSPSNTMTTVPDLSDCSVVIREHVTIAQVFGGAGHLLLKGSGAASTADQLLFYDNATGAFQTYWLRANAAGTIVSWRSLDSTDTADYSNTPIRPGVGLLVYRQPTAGAVTITHTGAVRTNAFRQPLPAGYSLVSAPAPITHSPAAADMVKSNGWTGSGSATASDQVQVWTGTGFNAYWFRANAAGTVQEWRNTNTADATNYMNSDSFISGSKALFVYKVQPDPEYIVDLVKQ